MTRTLTSPKVPLAELPPLISVIIPARNEQRNIRRCIQALLSQTYPNFEIIVVDDRSTDETPQILAELAEEDARLQIIHGAELPPGWAGKPHALVQGAAAAQGEWLCFMDADTFAEPESALVHLSPGDQISGRYVLHPDGPGAGQLLGTDGPAPGLSGSFLWISLLTA